MYVRYMHAQIKAHDDFEALLYVPVFFLSLLLYAPSVPKRIILTKMSSLSSFLGQGNQYVICEKLVQCRKPSVPSFFLQIFAPFLSAAYILKVKKICFPWMSFDLCICFQAYYS